MNLVKPMLAVSGQPFNSPEWIFEPKIERHQLPAGGILKRLNSVYLPGTRSQNWIMFRILEFSLGLLQKKTEGWTIAWRK